MVETIQIKLFTIHSPRFKPRAICVKMVETIQIETNDYHSQRFKPLAMNENNKPKPFKRFLNKLHYATFI